MEKAKVRRQFVARAAFIFMVMVVAVASVFLFTNGFNANAAGEAANEVETEVAASADNGIAYIAAALSTGIACLGAGIAVAITGSAALGALSEDPKLLGKTLIFVGLAEGIAIYGLIISIMILNKV